MNTFDIELKRWLDSGLNDSYISKHLNVDTETLENAKKGIYASRTVKKARLEPVSRPFPVITPDMRDTDRIILLTRHGISAAKIRKYLQQPLTARTINKYVLKKLGPGRRGNSSKDHFINPSTMPYVVEALRRLGKNPYTCELCLESVPKGCIIHHTKYVGATIYDLMYICISCNLSRENTGLV